MTTHYADEADIPAFRDMLATLRQRNIGTNGAGATPAEARRPATRTAKRLRIARLRGDVGIVPRRPYATAGAGGVATIDRATLPADITAARAQADLAIPRSHRGMEYTKDPTVAQQRVAHATIDTGAELPRRLAHRRLDAWDGSLRSQARPQIPYGDTMGNCTPDAGTISRAQ